MALEGILSQSDFLTYGGIAVLVVIVLVLLKQHFNGGICSITEVNLQGKYAVITGGNSGIGA